MNVMVEGDLRKRLTARVRSLLAERLAPGRAASAVFVGVTLGIVPIYGAQSIVALALATVLRLNRPLTLAATFVNNPLLQPFLVVGSLELGHRMLHGTWVSVAPAAIMAGGWRAHVGPFFLGSLALAVLLAAPLAAVTYVVFAWQARRKPGAAEAARTPSSEYDHSSGEDDGEALARFAADVRRRYSHARRSDRGFVRWKVRLDLIFRVLLEEDPGRGSVVDLGCGYGLALLAAAQKDPRRPLFGCDLDARRVAAAREALSSLDARIAVADAASYDIPLAGLVLIIDVLQYFDAAGQAALLSRCCRALEPGVRLVFRVPETRLGMTTRLTRWLDLAVFRAGGAAVRPTHLPADQYRRVLAELGLVTREVHARNRLPLSHVLFLAEKPEVTANG